MTTRVIPVDSRRADWPRLVSQEVARVGRMADRPFAVICMGKPTSSETIAMGIAAYDMAFAETLADARVASSGTAVFTIRKKTDWAASPVTMGTITFTSSASGVVAFSDPLISRNNIIEIVAPSTPDSALEDLRIILRG